MSDREGSGQSVAARGGIDNEDTFVADDNLGLYVVCDGASARVAGEVAAGIAARTVRGHIQRTVLDRGWGFRSRAFSRASAATSIERAFDAIHLEARAKPELAGMTTTLTMLLVSGARAVVGHVGDSRLYLARAGHLAQLTVDHPLTDAIAGLSSQLEIDAFVVDLRDDDVFLLATDGLNRVLEDPDWVIGQLRAHGVATIAARLLERAAALGGDEDVTLVVVRVRGDDPGMRLLHFVPRDVNLFHGLELAASRHAPGV